MYDKFAAETHQSLRMYLNMTRLLTFLLLFLAISGFEVSGQTQQPVRWRTFVKSTGDKGGVVTMKALVADGWHLYGLTLPKNGPKPTTFDFKASTDIEFTGKITPARPALEVDDPLFGMKLTWWDSNIEFTIPFKITGENPRFNCVINYMTCDGTTCRPPVRENIATPIKFKK